MNDEEKAGEMESAGENASGASRAKAAVAALEVAAYFAGILAYIWRWQYSFPHAWVFVLALILVGHLLHRDTLKGLGLAASGLGATARIILPFALVCYLPLVGYGFAERRLALLLPSWQCLPPIFGYTLWCAFQQYLAQSCLHNRLMAVMRNPHARALLIGLMFSATHLPNPVLTAATLVAGFVFAEAFSRYRNIWPLALTQAVGGILLATVCPDSIIHHMRVGPGFFFSDIR